ncbi:MAG: cobalamin B12-binding domain-containing protein [Caldilineaceae bacterium]
MSSSPNQASTATIAGQSCRPRTTDAGFEVIYTGIRQTPQMIAEAALQEDVDVVGLSILSGAHMTLCPKVVDLLRAQGQENVLVVIGGIVPDEDIPLLKEKGIAAVFGPGTSTEAIGDFIRNSVPGKVAA